MSESKKNLTTDFLVTFFVENRATSKMLSEVIKNRNNRLFLEELKLPYDFEVPFIQEEKENSVIYVYKQGLSNQYEVSVNGDSCVERIIQNGDYFTIKNRNNDHVIKILCINTSSIQIGYKKFKLPKDTNVFIGRMPINDIAFGFSNYISREKHAAIRVDSNGNAFIEDLKRSVGIYVNGYHTNSQQLRLFDEIFIMGLSIIYMGDFIAVRNIEVESTLSVMSSFSVKNPREAGEKNYFVSTPRILKSLDCGEIEVDAPPNPFIIDKTPAILVIGPSLTMSLVMVSSLGMSIANAISGGELSTIISSGTMAVGMLLGSLMWPSLLRNYQKKRTLADENNRRNKYMSYISDIEKELIAKKERTIRVLNENLCPSPDNLCSLLDNENKKLRLWERSYNDSDFLSVRLGLGDRPFDIQLKVPKKGFQLNEDEMRSLPEEIRKKYSVLSNVPLTLDLNRNRTVGVIGSRKNINEVLNEIILNIISLHSFDEVKLVIVTSPKREKEFEAFKNIPHIWSNDKKIRYFATNSDEVHFVFNVIDEVLREREIHQKENDTTGANIPHYVVIITEPELVEKEALCRFMNNPENEVGLTTVYAYGDITKLSRGCTTIIQTDDTRTGYYIKNENANRFIPFVLDKVDYNKIHTFAKELSQLPIKRDMRTMGIVDRISFLQMYRAGNVAELEIERHWDSNNSAKSLAVPIGVMAGGEVFSLDLHESYHGCHGLVAGTTGSGKSEFLQAFILSLAINYSPKEVAFVLVDFKGGDMARPFMAKTFSPALPHLAATISDLSGNILYRALVSLEAEITSRKRIFNEAAAELGVDKLDINSYHKYYKGGRLKTPLPHLVIVIDEFAQLKTQQPEFLAQLINVAQVGRSLGIHLILATQKPSGIVDPQIMSNSRFKVCLKVADKQDSVEMIGRPDSAKIKNPGRLYLQVGYDEIYECVQSGYSGAGYAPAKKYIPDEEITVQMTDHTGNSIHSAKIDISSGKSDKTQLEAVVTEIVALGQKKNIVAKQLWLDMLPESIVLKNLLKGKKGLATATIGLVDYVRTQEQNPLTFDFTKTGHLGVYGASGTGKTTFLQTLIYSMVCEYGYTPEELNIYAMDFGGRNLRHLEELPHTGGVVYADDEQKVEELVVVLQEIIDERKQIFAMNNCGTFADYRMVSNNILPVILVLIDNFSSFRDKYMDVSDSIISIISTGRTFGVYFVITGNTKNAIYYKVTEQISTYYTFKMNDPSNYFDIHNMRPSVIPEDINGRGITVINKEIVEFQIAVALDGETEADRISGIIQKYGELRENWNGYEPIKLSRESLDEEYEDCLLSLRPHVSLIKNITPDPIGEGKGNLVLGTSKSGASMYGMVLSEDYKVCICTSGMENFSNCYRNILRNISQYSGRKLVFIDDERSLFRDITEEYPSCRYVNSVSLLDEFIEELRPELNARLENPENSHEQIFIVMAEFNGFFNMISNEQAAFMRKVFRYIDTPQYGLYFICGFDVCGDKNNDSLFMSLVVNTENYLLCPNSYEQAVSKIEKLPIIYDVKNNSCYICQREKNAEIRW